MPATVDLGLSDADRFDDDHVETGGFADEHRFARLVGDATQRTRRRAGPDEGLVALAEQFHARLVAENRTAGDRRRRVDGEHGDPPAGVDQDRGRAIR
jgi:hypothetical protein